MAKEVSLLAEPSRLIRKGHFGLRRHDLVLDRALAAAGDDAEPLGKCRERRPTRKSLRRIGVDEDHVGLAGCGPRPEEAARPERSSDYTSGMRVQSFP